MFRGTRCEVDLGRLQANFKIFKKKFASTFLCPMIKANAYGHGDVRVAKVLKRKGAQWFGLGQVEEAVRLRESGIDTPLLLFGILSTPSVQAVQDYQLTPVLSDWNEIHLLEEKLSRPLSVHIKFNTGMNRLGFDIFESEKLVDFFQSSRLLKVTGICSHLLKGEDFLIPQGFSNDQHEKFAKLQKHWAAFKPQFHLFNSASALRLIQSGQSSLYGARPGIGLYGYCDVSSSPALSPVLSLKTQIIKMQKIKKGQPVSYNATWTSSKESLIGVLPLGYADGFHRLLSNRCEVLYKGQRLPLVGTVCMDYVMVDLTRVASVQPCLFDEVTVIGDDGSETLTANDLAQKAETIPYEVLTQLSLRLSRVYTNDLEEEEQDV